MNHGRLLQFVILVLPLTGCHSKVPDAAPSSPPSSISSPAKDGQTTANVSTPALPDKRPVIVAFGDSLTAGYGTNAGESYPDALQRDLNADGYRYRVANAGISGNTTKDGLERLSSVIALHPAIVIVAFGGNDGLRGLPINATRENLTTIVHTLQQSGAHVVLSGITLPPNYGPDYIQQFNDTYALLSKQFHVPLLPFLLKGVYGVPGGMQNDGLHATATGNETVARNLLPLLTPLLKKK